MDDLEHVFERLARSRFRSRFHLRAKEREYLNRKGLDVILEHGADFVEKRLAPADPEHDGRQTPMRNHPVFVAQHATGTCCRGCAEKWHRIPRGRALSLEEKDYILTVIRRWLCSQMERE
jgi:exodeoxyribonuclease V alpha subunit